MPLFYTVPDGEAGGVRLERIALPTFEVEALPSILKENTKHRQIYQQGYCKPPKPPYPYKWRGPRLRLTHKRPSMVPRRYRVSFTRINP